MYEGLVGLVNSHLQCQVEQPCAERLLSLSLPGMALTTSGRSLLRGALWRQLPPSGYAAVCGSSAMTHRKSALALLPGPHPLPPVFVVLPFRVADFPSV